MAEDDELTLRVVGRYQSQNIVNTLHYRIVGQASSEKQICASLIAGFEADIEAAWLARHVDAYDLIGYKAFRKTGDPKTPAFSAVGSAGGVATPGLPAFICRTITLYTDSSIPQRRGRLMLSGTAADQLQVDDGSLTAAEIALLDALAALIVLEMDNAGDTFQVCIPAGVDHESNPIPTEDITDYKARETPSSVTKRRIRQFLIG